MKSEFKNVSFTEFCDVLKQKGYKELAEKLIPVPQGDVTNEANIGQLLTNIQNFVCRSIKVEKIRMLVRWFQGELTSTTLLVNLSEEAEVRFGFFVDKKISYKRTQDGEWKYTLTFVLVCLGKTHEEYTAVALEWY